MAALGLWKNETRDTIFTLIVDDFAIKYTSLDNAQHMLHTLKENIYHIRILGGKTRHWNQLKVGLQQTNSWPLHARVCNRRPTTVPPSTQKYLAIIPTPPCPTNIWRQSKIFWTRGRYTAPARRMTQIYPASRGRFLILCHIHRQHSTSCPYQHWIRTSQSNF